MRFEVLDGKHADRDGNVYKKGEVIEASSRLDQRFSPSKFRRLSKGQQTTAEMEAEEAKEKAAFEKHREGRRKTQIEVPEDEDELAEDDPTLSARGKEQTEEFSRANEHDLEVFSRRGRYHVFKRGSNEPLNEKGLARGEVNKFIKGFMET